MFKSLLSRCCLSSFILFNASVHATEAHPSTSNKTVVDNVELKVGVANPVMLANKTQQKVYLKTALIGAPLSQNQDRSPVNIALVLDKSGSMSGDRMIAAKQASIIAINHLQAEDIVSVVRYDTRVKVIIPATKVSNKQAITQKINRLSAGGSTALYAGVEQGALEVEKFMDDNHINRVILLSDGKANVGLKSVSALAKLGERLGGKGISVTTIGLGSSYNEDLMSQLASYSDGNHAYAKHTSDLDKIFNLEFGDVTAVIAKNIQINIHCATDVKPLQVMGREDTVQGQNIHVRLNQLVAGQEKFILTELEVPISEAGSQRVLVNITVDYFDLQQQKNIQKTAQQTVTFTDSKQVVLEATDNEVMGVAVEQIANKMSKEAVKLRDEGEVQAAKGLLDRTANYLRGFASSYESETLKQQAEQAQDDADNMGESDWNVQRKSLREQQHKKDRQQTY